ncbi:glutaredoxin [Vararia minispora EC-137]|uniref:Glutaredoxin n=1 Tax=Vararia minispora EC-137 TaxID=1314806 RepID=A0ACB8QHM8_9AGAM|nr:glutaredoxin [Vararia minispora EC-137]
MAVKDRVDSAIANNKVIIFSKSWCPYCRRAKSIMNENYKETPIEIIELDEDPEGAQIQSYLTELTGQSTVPNIFINKKHVGGSDDLAGLHRVGGIQKLLL